MRINSKEVLYGQPILKIREVVRHTMRPYLTGDSKSELICKVAFILKEPNSVVKEVLELMIQDDYLLLNKERFGGKYRYNLKATLKGRQFGIANASPPLSREKATQLLNELIDRAKAINANEELVFIVESLKVFGSYLTDKEVLGDLDIGFKLRRRYDDDEFKQRSEQRSDLARENGRQFKSWTGELFWSETEVLLMLKNKQRGLSLHNEDSDEVFNVAGLKTMLVYFYKEDIVDSKKII
ncbi:MAG TPA: hypothetical protein VFG54_06650 [Prolixibacteraceae bacterium]|nr:hypothetical protein [Prolixibacteraceae bacterium]